MEPQDTLPIERRLPVVLRMARSPYIGERAEAERAFSAMGPAGIEHLIRLAAAKHRNWRRRRRIYFWLLGIFVCVALPVFIYLIAGAIAAGINGDTRLMGDRLGGALGGILGGFGGGILGGFAWLLVPPPETALAAHLLARADDLRGIGALARVLEMRFADPEVRYAAAKALARLLPRIGSDNASVVAADDRAALARYLLRSQPEKEEELVLAMLSALAWSGDSETLRALRTFEKRITEPQPALRWAAEFSDERKILGLYYNKRRPIADRMDERHAFTQPPTPRLRDATRDAVARLESRLEALAKGDMLLRAAENAEHAADTLLRPTLGVGPDDPAVLLRAGQSPDSAPSS